MEEMRGQGAYAEFKNQIDAEREEIGRFGKLKEQEKQYNDDIKNFQDKLKKNNEEFATEQQQSVEDISKLKKNVNETKTESELQVQYMKRVISGSIACMERKQKMEETKLSDEISYLKKQIEVEKTVSA